MSDENNSQLTNRRHITRLDQEDHLNELLGILQLIYQDTQRTMKAMNTELAIWDDIIERTMDAGMRDQYRLKQAQAAQKSSVNAKLIAQLLAAMDRMKVLTDEDNQKHRTAEVVFIDDTEK